MCQHEVADALRIAQAAAMADHQPGFRAQHRQMVTDGFRIRRADTDIDEGNAVPARRDQVICRHLVAPPCRIGQPPARVRRIGIKIAAARASQRGIAVLADLRTGIVNEFIYITMIVREQNEVLDMLRVGAGVMREPCQTEIRAQRIEQGEGDRIVRRGQIVAVDKLVADMGKFRCRKMAGKFNRRDRAEIGRHVDYIGKGNFLPRTAYFKRNFVIGSKQRELLPQEVRE